MSQNDPAKANEMRQKNKRSLAKDETIGHETYAIERNRIPSKQSIWDLFFSKLKIFSEFVIAENLETIVRSINSKRNFT